MSSINYTTVEGDTWDNIAYKFYGDIKAMNTITDANLNVPLDEILPIGTNLVIPIIEDNDTAVLTENVPPWKN